jgi:hypothetical protein
VRALAAAALLLVIAACGGGGGAEDDSPSKIAADVTIQLRYPLIAEALSTEDAAGEECAGALDYDTITTGSKVTFRDADGKIVATAELAAPGPSDSLVSCTWKESTRLPAGSESFTAEVGGWTSEPQEVAGGRVTFTLDTVKEDAEAGSKAEIDPTWSE